jgi:hypothetical protein
MSDKWWINLGDTALAEVWADEMYAVRALSCNIVACIPEFVLRAMEVYYR